MGLSVCMCNTGRWEEGTAEEGGGEAGVGQGWDVIHVESCQRGTQEEKDRGMTLPPRLSSFLSVLH